MAEKDQSSYGKSHRDSHCIDRRTFGRFGKFATHPSRSHKSQLPRSRLRKPSAWTVVRARRDAALWSGVWIFAPSPAECHRRAGLYIRAGCRHSWRVLRPADERVHKRVPRCEIGRSGCPSKSRRDCPQEVLKRLNRAFGVDRCHCQNSATLGGCVVGANRCQESDRHRDRVTNQRAE